MKGWRTLLFAIITTVIGTLEGFNWTTVIPDNIEPYLIPIIGVFFIYLRGITNTPMGQSTHDDPDTDIGGGGVSDPTGGGKK